MFASIFNDVIGPVMRGASSSHCAGALRIGRLARDLMAAKFDDVLVEYDRSGSLPATYESHGSGMGMLGGLMGWDAADDRLTDSAGLLRKAGITVRVATVDSGDVHPNTYRLTLRGGNEQHSLIAISTGGGMITVISIDGFKVSISGECCETLLWLDSRGTEAAAMLKRQSGADEVILLEADGRQLVEVKGASFLSEQVLADLSSSFDISAVRFLAPVLPVMSCKEMSVPFTTCEEMIRCDAGQNLPLWKHAVAYEMARGGLSEERVMAMMTDIVRIVRRSIQQGLDGTQYSDRLLGYQSGLFNDLMKSGRLLNGGALNRIILYVTALMEVKSSMGVIVAAPTAGACAALPGAVIAMAEEMGLGEEDMARAMLASGLIGVFITTRWTFAAEVGGCQAECGSAGCMAAAALVTLANGTLSQSVATSSMALQSMLGLICGPIANRVEAPCLGKNVMAASNALASANMALGGYDPLIPLDEVIETAKNVGSQLPRELRCTALGGLSVSPTSLELEQMLGAKKAAACGRGCGCKKR